MNKSDIIQIAKHMASAAMDNPITAGARWLKINHAAIYSSIGKHRLKKLALDDGSLIIGYPDPGSGKGDWIFDRESLDAYREDQALKGDRIRMKALDIMRRHGI